MCKHCPGVEDCAHDRETDTWVVPSGLTDLFATPTHSGGLFPSITQETPMPTITRTITVRLDPELVALLTEIRDRLPEPKREEAFVERHPAAVGHNLRHWKPGVHTAGVDCSCGPEKVPHERAPREDEDPDEALARVIFGDAYGSHEGLRLAQLDVARAAREHIETERAAKGEQR